MVVSSNPFLLVSMETYLLGVLEHLKCGYCFDVTELSQFLGKKRHSFDDFSLYQVCYLVTSKKHCLCEVTVLVTFSVPSVLLDDF